MRRTFKSVVLSLLLYVGMGGVVSAMPRNVYEGCAGNSEEQLEAASLNAFAETIYYEAGNQPTKGKVAVAFVILNRAKKNNLSICEVVYQPGQFYWTTSAVRRRPKNQNQWEECLALAKAIFEDSEQYEDPTKGALAFRRPIDAPFPKQWIASVRIGGHIFYSVP